VAILFCVRDSSGKPTADENYFFTINLARTWNG